MLNARSRQPTGVDFPKECFIWGQENRRGTCSLPHLHATANASLNLSEIGTCSAVLRATHTLTHLRTFRHRQTLHTEQDIWLLKQHQSQFITVASHTRWERGGWWHNIYNTILWSTFALSPSFPRLFPFTGMWYGPCLQSVPTSSSVSCVHFYLSRLMFNWNWFAFINGCPGMVWAATTFVKVT